LKCAIEKRKEERKGKITHPTKKGKRSMPKNWGAGRDKAKKTQQKKRKERDTKKSRSGRSVHRFTNLGMVVGVDGQTRREGGE